MSALVSTTSVPIPDGVPEPPLLVVTVGTDHHPFARALRWVAEARQRHPQLGACRLWVQRGTAPGGAPGPSVDRSSDYLSFDQLQAWLSAADAVVCHGGPATLFEAVRAGHRPVVLPRSHALGEHVDDHQQLFAAQMARQGLCRVPRDPDELAAALRAALAGEVGPAALEAGAGAERVAGLLGAVVRPRSLVAGAGRPTPR